MRGNRRKGSPILGCFVMGKSLALEKISSYVVKLKFVNCVCLNQLFQLVEVCCWCC